MPLPPCSLAALVCPPGDRRLQVRRWRRSREAQEVGRVPRSGHRFERCVAAHRSFGRCDRGVRAGPPGHERGGHRLGADGRQG
eukprot:897419-Pyramimonas_sp.AAC.1